MQRWIGLAVVLFVLLTGGAWYGYRQIKANRPHPVWVPLAINGALSREDQLKAVAEIEKALRKPEVLRDICADLSLTESWGISQADACISELKSRIFVKTGTMDTPKGSQPAILVGIRGKVKHKEISEKICMRMMEDVAKALNLPPPPKGRPPGAPAP